MNPTITRFYTLDILRGLAALLIAIFHYIRHHVHSEDIVPNSWLSITYIHGWRAIDLFFCLSGFIFFWKYSNAIYEKSIGFKKFVYLRFSRLYPLHLATLIIVGASQFFVYLSDKEYFIFQINDLKHLLLNILFISSWGFESGYSFNGPIWSVSLEILLYLVFYLCCFHLRPTNLIWPLLLVILGGLLLSAHYQVIIFHTLFGRGLFSFFAGGLSYQVFQIAISSHQKKYIGTIILVGGIALAFWLNLRFLYIYLGYWFSEVLFMIGFPSVVLLLAFLDAKNIFAYVFKKISYIGEISYSIYLIHFPVQILFHLASKQFPIDYSKTGTFLLYLACAIGLSIASHKLFEIPCQNYLRSKFPVK